MSAPIRVISVDDHAVVREGIAYILGRESDISLVGSAATGAEGIALYTSKAPDVALVDLRLPDMTGVDVILAIKQRDPVGRLIVLTIYSGDEDIARAFEVGAALYLLKETLSGELVRAIRDVYSGTHRIKTGLVPDHMSRTHERLTRREKEVLGFVSQGMRNKEIAVSMGISETTVQVHIKNIFAKLGVHDRTGAVSVALRRGIVHFDP